MNKILVILAVLMLGFANAHAQVDAAKAEKLKKKNLVYYWVGRACPGYNLYLEEYGFGIRCVGCQETLSTWIHNQLVIRRIEQVYGRGWFAENRRNFH